MRSHFFHFPRAQGSRALHESGSPCWRLRLRVCPSTPSRKIKPLPTDAYANAVCVHEQKGKRRWEVWNREQRVLLQAAKTIPASDHMCSLELGPLYKHSTRDPTIVSPKISILKSNPPCYGIWRWGPWEVLGS